MGTEQFQRQYYVISPCPSNNLLLPPMSFASERRLGLPRANDLSRYQTTAHRDDSDSDGAAASYDSEDEEEQRLSRQHGEAQDVDEAKSGDKKRKPTDAEIAAEYNDSKKVKTKKPRRKVIDESDLTKPHGLSSIFLNFPRQFNQRTYKKNRKDMAKFSLQLVSAYQEWADRIVPGTPLEEVLWKINTFNSKTSVKRHVQTMRNEVRNHHIERIYGLEKADQLLSQLDDSNAEESTWNANGGPEADAVREPEDPPDASPVAAAPINATTETAPLAQEQRPDMDGEDPLDEDDYHDMHDMVPVEKYDYPEELDVEDTVHVVPEPKSIVPVTGHTISTPIVPSNPLKNNRRRILDDDDDELSGEEEEAQVVHDDVAGVAAVTAPPSSSRGMILEDSDDEKEFELDMEMPKKDDAQMEKPDTVARDCDKEGQGEKDLQANKDESSGKAETDRTSALINKVDADCIHPESQLVSKKPESKDIMLTVDRITSPPTGQASEGFDSDDEEFEFEN